MTDDTQMMLAVGEALVQLSGPLDVHAVEGPLRAAFVAWLDSPDNNRAPGRTCLEACKALKEGQPFSIATIAGSKGCGANMRTQPVGLLSLNGDERAGLAQFQAALTHGHPTALAAADLTATAIAFLTEGETPTRLLERLQTYAHGERLKYHEAWLGPLWRRPGATTPEDFIARGWDECLGALDRVTSALAIADREADPCLATGAGWVAEEALATGLLCFLLDPDDPLATVRRAAVTSGDSDSIACLAGSFAGARHGLNAWPASWVERIEYRDRLAALGCAWDAGVV